MELPRVKRSLELMGEIFGNSGRLNGETTIDDIREEMEFVHDTLAVLYDLWRETDLVLGLERNGKRPTERAMQRIVDDEYELS